MNLRRVRPLRRRAVRHIAHVRLPPEDKVVGKNRAGDGLVNTVICNVRIADLGDKGVVRAWAMCLHHRHVQGISARARASLIRSWRAALASEAKVCPFERRWRPFITSRYLKPFPRPTTFPEHIRVKLVAL